MAFALTNLLGLLGFVWPLLLGVAGPAGENQAHATDAPVLLAMLVPLLVLVAMRTLTEEHADARLIALLGALVAINAFLRIPKGPSGEGLVFILPVLVGWFVGARFGFLLGAFSMLASAVLTGGIGPWLPFQMFALGWVGAGSGVLRRVVRGRLPVVSLGVYAYVSSVAYGYLMTLWFWPFLGSGNTFLYSSGLGFVPALARYTRFYLLTSLPWDTGRALLANVPLVVVLARPLGRMLSRIRERFEAEIIVVPEAAAEVARTRSAPTGDEPSPR
jgi:energy-coupling factor transport system substrate-specific component